MLLSQQVQIIRPKYRLQLNNPDFKLERSFLHTSMKIIMVVYYLLIKLISTLGSVSEYRGFVLNCPKETLLPMADIIIFETVLLWKRIKM